jgi:hypothetical protein
MMAGGSGDAGGTAARTFIGLLSAGCADHGTPV